MGKTITYELADVEGVKVGDVAVWIYDLNDLERADGTSRTKRNVIKHFIVKVVEANSFETDEGDTSQCKAIYKEDKPQPFCFVQNDELKKIVAVDSKGNEKNVPWEEWKKIIKDNKWNSGKW